MKKQIEDKQSRAPLGTEVQCLSRNAWNPVCALTVIRIWQMLEEGKMLATGEGVKAPVCTLTPDRLGRHRFV